MVVEQVANLCGTCCKHGPPSGLRLPFQFNNFKQTLHVLESWGTFQMYIKERYLHNESSHINDWASAVNTQTIMSPLFPSALHGAHRGAHGLRGCTRLTGVHTAYRGAQCLQGCTELTGVHTANRGCMLLTV